MFNSLFRPREKLSSPLDELSVEKICAKPSKKVFSGDFPIEEMFNDLGGLLNDWYWAIYLNLPNDFPCMLIVSKSSKNIVTKQKFVAASTVYKSQTVVYGYCKHNKDTKFTILLYTDAKDVRFDIYQKADCSHGNSIVVQRCSARIRDETKELLRKTTAQNVKTANVLRNSNKRIKDGNVDFPYELPDSDDFADLTKLEKYLKSIENSNDIEDPGYITKLSKTCQGN